MKKYDYFLVYDKDTGAFDLMRDKHPSNLALSAYNSLGRWIYIPILKKTFEEFDELFNG